MAGQLDPRALDVQSRLGIIGTGFAMQKQVQTIKRFWEKKGVYIFHKVVKGRGRK